MSVEDSATTLKFQKFLRSQIEWIRILRGELKSLRIGSITFEAELWWIHGDIKKLREDEHSYVNPVAVATENLRTYMATNILIDTAKSELSELEKDWQDLFKRS